LVIYKSEGYKQFQNLTDTIQHDVVHTIYHVGLVKKEAPLPTTTAKSVLGSKNKHKLRTSDNKIGRNTPCPCGSGRKYKYCCGR
jgi:preprotein translocase subunit SecA